MAIPPGMTRSHRPPDAASAGTAANAKPPFAASLFTLRSV